MEDDFFASFEPVKPSAQKKDSSKFDAIAIELRRKKMIEQAVQEADLDNARDLFGESSLSSRRQDSSMGSRGFQSDESIDSSLPDSKAEFDHLASMIIEKVSSFKSNKNFDAFVDTLVNGLIKNCGSADLSKKLAQLTVGGGAAGKGITIKPAKKSVSLSDAGSRKKDTSIDYSNYDELSDHDEFSN